MIAISVLAFPPFAIVACAANYNTTPNMGLQVPIPGVETGPAWAQDINNSLNLIDQHDHTPGSGVPVPSSGLNINSNLSFQGNFITSLGAEVFTAQTGDPTSGYSAYTKGVDLYYKDGSGNIIQITSGGGVNGSPGSISNLTSPASASFVSANGTFVWQQSTSTAANMDAATLIIRYPGSYPSPSGNYIAIQAPTSLATGYALTLPAALPAASSSSIVFNTSGAGSYLTPDGIGSGMTSVGANAIGVSMAPTGANAVANTRTRAVGTSVGAGGVAISPDCGSFSTTSTSFVTITNLSVSIVTTGRPVMMFLQATGAASLPSSVLPNAGNSSEVGEVQIAGTTSTTPIWEVSSSGQFLSGGNYAFVDTPPAGTQTYTYQVKVIVGSMEAIHVQMVAYEL